MTPGGSLRDHNQSQKSEVRSTIEKIEVRSTNEKTTLGSRGGFLHSWYNTGITVVKYFIINML